MKSERSYSVLIVEDERIVAKDLQQTLRGIGYDAYAIASSSEEAVLRASQRCPDIVLMDIRIKGPTDGIETAALLRDRFAVPVVYLTAHADEATLERAKETEPYGYLIKPVRVADLRSAIEVSIYRHQLTKRLRERERWFSTTLRSIADAVITVDIAGNVTFMNAVAEQLTGVTSDFALGRPAREIVRLLDPAQSASPLEDALRARTPIFVEDAPLAHANGGRIISDSASPVVDGEELLGAVMVFRDVTKQKTLQKQLELADRLVSLGTLAAGVAHEINNPLASIVANVSYVLDELERALPTDPTALARRADAIDAQRDIESAADRIAKIVGSLHVFSRPTSAPADGDSEVIRVVQWAIRTTSHELRARATVKVDIGRLPSVKIDDTRLGQVLVNLLVNAAHAIEPGNVDRNTVTLSARQDGETVVLEIRDTGKGMPAEVVKHIFDPFFTTKAVGEGSGLGLAICHGIVAAVGGKLEAESVPGAGTTFRLVLPVAAPMSSAPPVAPPIEAPVFGRILAIDDEPGILRAIVRVLRGHEVVCVGAARDALGLLAAGQRFDVIVSDLMMPQMTGRQLYEQLLVDHPEAVRTVVFLTGGVTGENGDAFLAAIPNASVAKPAFAAGLRAAVDGLLREAHPGRRTD